MTERFPLITKLELDVQRGVLLITHGFLQFDNIGGKIQPSLATNPNGPQEILLNENFFIAQTIPTEIDNTTGTTLTLSGTGFQEGMTGVFDDGVNTPVNASSVTWLSNNSCEVVYPIATQQNPTVLTLTRLDGATASIQVGVAD